MKNKGGEEEKEEEGKGKEGDDSDEGNAQCHRDVYLIENHVHTLARDLLLLFVASESCIDYGLQEKAQLMLELFGNSLIRTPTYEYLIKAADGLIKCVTNEEYLKRRMPFVDLKDLKYREKDELENVLKFWQYKKSKRDTDSFDIVEQWENRLRKYYGYRFDSRKNICDWDFTMKLTEKGAQIINGQLFYHWRNTGVAFRNRDGDYCVPNRTLASKDPTGKTKLYGYFGDIVTGPYITFGIQSNEKSFFKKRNDVLVHSSEDVAEFNICEKLEAIQTGRTYVLPPRKPHPFLNDEAKSTEENVPKIEEVTEEEPEDNEKVQAEESSKESEKERETEQEKKLVNKLYRVQLNKNLKPPTPLFAPEEPSVEGEEEKKAKIEASLEACSILGQRISNHCSVHLFSRDHLGILSKKKQFVKDKLDMIFYGATMIGDIDPDVKEILNPGGLLVLENVKYVLDLKDEQRKAFAESIREKIENLGFRVSVRHHDTNVLDFKSDDYFVFVKLEEKKV
eukprot:Nk52_evm27s123 gene=Nk52_evmTU27s123